MEFINTSIKKGFSFGLVSGIITTLGLIVGLHSGTHSKLVVLGGIITIAVADAFSDALGVHVSEESEIKHSIKEIWTSTISCFLAKFFFALTFSIPVLLFELNIAIVVSVVYGLFLIAIFSYYIAKQEKTEKPVKVILEHIVIAILVILITHYIGDWASNLS
jgi:VIT1/CCC1 family predicted Fe2+/Mn2+ transporter